MREYENDVTNGEVERAGEDTLRVTPRGIASSLVGKPVTTAFILSSTSDDSVTVSVYTENAGSE